MTYFRKLPYNIAVVGAARGIGRAAAELLSVEGASIACLDSNLDGVEATARTIGAGKGEAFAQPLDIAQPTSVEAAFGQVFLRFGQLHALVNCAGITGRSNIRGHEVDLADFDRVVPHEPAGRPHSVAGHDPLHADIGFERILHIASIAGMTAYSATKAGLIGLIKSFAKDYVLDGLTIDALAPAVVRTAMVGALPEATVKYMTDKNPRAAHRRAGRGGGPHRLDRVARLQLHLQPEWRPGDLLTATGIGREETSHVENC